MVPKRASSYLLEHDRILQRDSPTKFEYYMDPELSLLGSDPVLDGFDSSANEGLKNAPIFTGDALEVAGLEVFPQRALYGRIMAQECEGFSSTVDSSKLFINTNAPFSGLTCGVQGSGKSHSTSVLLESCLICDDRLGTLPAPLSALLFHFDTAAGGGHLQPCEAAYLACLDETRGGNAKPPNVTVLVMPNTLRAMKKVYSVLSQVQVEALHFSQEDISGERLLAMMKVDQEKQMPLYMECIMNILRSMEDTFNYAEFRRQLSEEKFSPTQKAMLDLRLGLLESCLKDGSVLNRVSRHFNKGQLTIIDLSSPFMDGPSACGFFDIILGLFIEAKTEASGKIVVLDEAHKYLTNSGSSSRLSDSLLSVIRQQRHLATRVLISTQEPTVVPSEFLDLCSFVIAHRFSSPRWLEHLKRHLPSLDIQSFSRAFTLKTGEAMMFAPAGVGLRDNARAQKDPTCAPFGAGYLLVRSRERITKDGGRSLLAASRITPATPGTARRMETASDPELEGVLPSTSTALDLSDDTQSDDAGHVQFLNRVVNDIKLPPVSIIEGNTGVGNLMSTPLQAFTHEPPAQIHQAVQKLSGSLTSVEPRFRVLVHELAGQGRVSWTTIGIALKTHSPPPYEGKLRKYLELAAEAKLVDVGDGVSPSSQWVQLAESTHVPSQFVPLVETMRGFLADGYARPWFSDIAKELKNNYVKPYIGSFKDYAQAAEVAGVVKCDRSRDRLSLW